MKEIPRTASLALGEAYMEHRIEIEGSIQALINDAYQQANSFLRGKDYLKWLPKKEKHTKQKNKEDIHAHYDLGNDFYKLWLDPTLTYSCAYFNTPEDTLEQAQINKVHHILDKLFIKEGETLLDIGCGWGTLMFTATKEYNVKATGITLSEEQYDLITKRIKEEHLEDKCRVLLMDYRELKGETFDHITSVGMFEHVGSENLEGYFKVVKDLLKPKGTALIHGISRQQGGATNAWINKYIFPGGYVPGVTELVDNITKNDLQLIDLESLRRDELKGETFDHITSVGMFEHVGSENLEGYFKVVKDLLKPKGTALIHGISRQQGGATNAWINKYIFPGGYVPGVTELVDNITKNDLQLIDLESLRRDYQLTLEHWTKNFHQVQDQVTKEMGDSFYRMWDLYLQACAASFESSNIDVIQYLLVQPGNNDIPMHRA